MTKKPREVAVAIPFRTNTSTGLKEICLVTSRKRQEWVLPKGGVEKGETSRIASVREMWEEGESGYALRWRGSC